jgi:hypothetical protein
MVRQNLKMLPDARQNPGKSAPHTFDGLTMTETDFGKA